MTFVLELTQTYSEIKVETPDPMPCTADSIFRSSKSAIVASYGAAFIVNALDPDQNYASFITRPALVSFNGV